MLPRGQLAFFIQRTPKMIRGWPVESSCRVCASRAPSRVCRHRKFTPLPSQNRPWRRPNHRPSTLVSQQFFGEVCIRRQLRPAPSELARGPSSALSGRMNQPRLHRRVCRETRMWPTFSLSTPASIRVAIVANCFPVPTLSTNIAQTRRTRLRDPSSQLTAALCVPIAARAIRHDRNATAECATATGSMAKTSRTLSQPRWRRRTILLFRRKLGTWRQQQIASPYSRRINSQFRCSSRRLPVVASRDQQC